jgi:hypothetical protein
MGKAALQASLNTLDVWLIIFGLLVAIGAVGGSVAGFLHWRRSGELQTILAGCGKTRRLEKIAQKSARNQKSGPVKSMGYRNAEGHGLLRKQHRPTFSATC